MTATSIRMGEVRIDPILDGVMSISRTKIYPDATDADWAPHLDHLNGEGMIEAPYGGFLVRGPEGRTVMVDIGGGPTFAVPDGMGRLHSSVRLLDNLAALGVAAEDVTDVIPTHLHHDHAGWSSVDERATFPNAAYRCHEADWDYYVKGDAKKKVQDVMRPVESHARLWADSFELFPWLRLEHVPGHTPGNAMVVVESDGRRLAIIGDIAHSPLDFVHPEWRCGVDGDPRLAAQQRARTFDDLADGQTLVVGPHFPEQAAGRLSREDGRFRWTLADDDTPEG